MAQAAEPLFTCQAALAAFGPVDVQIYAKSEGHVRLVLLDSAHPEEVVVSDATDGSLLHSYERIDESTHLFGAVVYAGKRQMGDVRLKFNSEADADKLARTVFSRYTGGADESRTWLYPTKCGILEKGSGCLDRHQNRWFLFQRCCWLSYWRSPRDQLPIGVVDWRSVTRVGVPSSIHNSAGEIELEVRRGTSGVRVHHLRAKTSEAAARWIEVLTERPLADFSADQEGAPVLPEAAEVPSVAQADVPPAERGAWRPVCGVPLETLLAIEERQGSVPVLVASVVNAIASSAGSCSASIFNGSGSPGFVFAAKGTLEAGQDPTPVFDAAPDGLEVAGTLLLKFLYDLPDPLCTEDRALAFLSTIDTPKPVDGLKEIVSDLPEANSTLLQYLISFLKLLAQHQDESGLSPAVLASALGPAMFRELTVLPGIRQCDSATKVVELLMDNSENIWSGAPTLIQMPAYRNLTWKLLLVGRLLRVTPDDIERKLIALEEVATLDKALASAQAAGAISQASSISSKIERIETEFYQMESKCAAGNVKFRDDQVSPGLLYAVRDHIELLKQEELNLRAAFRKCCKDKDRPAVELRDVKGVLEACARVLSLGDFMLDAQDMFTELFYLKNEKKRAFSLPEFLDVLGKWMELYGLFRKHDRFKQGHVTVGNMVEAMEEFGALFGYKPTPFHVMALLNEFDIDREFGVTWEEFRLLMHRWIEEKKKGEDIGKGAHQVDALVTQDVLDPITVQELRVLFDKFKKPNGAFDVLELGAMFEEICYSYSLGGTLSDLFRLFRAVESCQDVGWNQFVSVMGKWIILRQLFANYSKDGGQTVLTADLEFPLRDLKDMWGCFDPRHGNSDVSVMAKQLASSVNSQVMSFEEFTNGLRTQVAFKVIFEQHDPRNTGTLNYDASLSAFRSLEDYCGLTSTFAKGMQTLEPSRMDCDVEITWPEFLVIAHVAVGDEYDGSI